MRFILALAVLLATSAAASDRYLLLQSTTSTQNSGLFDYLLPIFTDETGIDVRVVAVGTGQAIRNAARGDGDALLTHDRAAEEAFVADGHGLARHDVMANDFVIVGPKNDPANIRDARDAADVLARIAGAEAAFVSRGDDSGTHKAELRLWKKSGVDPAGASGTWYRETGSGMGASLRVAAEMGAYLLTDRSSWAAFGHRRDLVILFEGDPVLRNQYGVIAVNPERHPNVHAEEAAAFVDWILSPAGQDAIAAFRIDGQQVFFPNAR